MTAAEFRRWIAYDQISPIGDERADLNAANIVHIIASGFGSFAKNPKRVQFRDCVLRFDVRDEEHKRTFAAKMRHYLVGLTKTLGGTINGKNYSGTERNAKP